jgi:hypothetical protein
MDKLTGIHAVKEALEAGRPLEYVLVAQGRQDTRAEEIVQLARRNGIPVRFEERAQLDRAAGTRDHQGVVALGAARAAATFDDILAAGNKDYGKPGLIVLLDGVEDPHNLARLFAQRWRRCARRDYSGAPRGRTYGYGCACVSGRWRICRWRKSPISFARWKY